MQGGETKVDEGLEKPDLDGWPVKENLAADLEKFAGESDFAMNFTVKWTRIADEWKKSIAKEFAKKKAAEKEKMLTNKQIRN